MDCDFSPSSPHLLPNGLFSPQNRISFELLALSGLLGFSTFKGGKMLIFQGFANSRIVREFPPFSFKVRIATLTRNQVVAQAARGFESHPIRHDHASSRFFRLLAFLFARNQTGGQYQPRADTPSQTPFAIIYSGALKRLVRGTSAKVTYQLHEPFQSMGSVSVTGKNIDMKKVVWFVRSAELASKSVVYPKTDGTVCMTFPFHGLTRPIE